MDRDDIEVPEASAGGQNASVPPNLAHMRIATQDGVLLSRVRLTGTITADNLIEEKIEYTLNAVPHFSSLDQALKVRSVYGAWARD